MGSMAEDFQSAVERIQAQAEMPVAEVERIREAFLRMSPIAATVVVSGGTAGSAALLCGECYDHEYLDSAGSWGGPDNSRITLGALAEAVAAHIEGCKSTPK